MDVLLFYLLVLKMQIMEGTVSKDLLFTYKENLEAVDIYPKLFSNIRSSGIKKRKHVPCFTADV